MRIALAVTVALLSAQAAHAEMMIIKRDALPPDVVDKLNRLASVQTQAMSFGVAGQGPEISLDGEKYAPFDFGRLLKQSIGVEDAKMEAAQALLGKGFDLWTGQLFETCVTPGAVLVQKLPVGGRNRHNSYHFREINSLQEHHSDRSSGGSLSFAYDLFSFGGATQEDSGQVFSSNSRYIDAYMTFIGDEYYMNDGSPTDTAVGRLKDTGNEGFSKICGQQFITRVGFGIQLDARLSAKVEINKKTEGNQNSVSIGFGEILNFGANSKDKMSEVSQHSSLGVDIKGAAGTMPKPDELVEYARTFGDPATVSISPQEVYIETAPYSQVGYQLFRDFDNTVQVAGGTVLSLQYSRMLAVQRMADISEALAHPDFVEATTLPPGADLEALQKQYTTYVDALGKLWTVCRKALDAAGITTCENAAMSIPAMPADPHLKLKGQDPV